MSFNPEHAVAWTEIPVSNMDDAIKFYRTVFEYDMTLDTSGPNPMAIYPNKDATLGVHGHLYPGKPAGDGSGPTVHLTVTGKLEDAMARCDTAGGKVLCPPISIPPGRFVYAHDPDGNSIGLFEKVA